MTKRYLTIPAVVAGAFGLSAVARADEPAQTREPTTAELMKQIDQLQAQVKKMEARQEESLSAKAVDDTVARVLREADKRSQLLQMEGFTAGFNNDRFTVQSADGESSISPYLQMQFRTTTNIATEDDDDTENGFSLPRVKLGFDGTIFSKQLEYYFRWNSGDSDGGGSGGLNLEQAWLRYQFADQWGVRLGQFIDPVFHEQLVNSDRQLAADRSLLNLIISGADESYTQGVTMIWSPGEERHINVEVGFTDGVNTANTSFRDFPTGPTNFGVVGRAEFVIFGNTNAYKDFTAMGNTDQGVLVIGAGGDWTQSGDTDNLLHTVDAQWETPDGKFSLYGAYVGQYIMSGAGTGITGVTGGDDDNYNWGVLVQAGLMLNENWELFGRYDYTQLDDEIAAGTGNTEDTFHEITGGVNYYFRGHHAKFTVDLSWLPGGAPAGADNLGILASEDDQFIVRGQFQLML